MERRQNDKISMRALLAIVTALVVPLQGMTFAYAMQIEHRLTRLEATLKLNGAAANAARESRQAARPVALE